MNVITRSSTPPTSSSFFFFNDTATTEIYTLSLHDALPISYLRACVDAKGDPNAIPPGPWDSWLERERDSIKDRKSTRLNSSHSQISYAVFCLKKKKQINNNNDQRHLKRLCRCDYT